jgi:hypothetical protein
LVGGETMAAALDGRPLADPRPPRLETVRPINGALLRVAMLGGGRADVTRARPRASRSPAASAETPTPERRAPLLRASTPPSGCSPSPLSMMALGLLHGAAVIAATEPLPSPKNPA